MADQVLSQDEIDALLTAMDKGEVDLEGEQQAGAEAQPYDITSQSRTLRNQFEALEEVFDKFQKSLRAGLISLFQKNIEVQVVSKEMVRFADFIKPFGNPTGFTIFSMEPLIGSSMLTFEADLFFALIDTMFGGPGKPLPEVREFTRLEVRLLRKTAQVVLKELEQDWRIVCPVEVQLKKTETKPDYVRLAGPNDLMLVIAVTIGLEDFSGNIYICLPYLMLDPIKEKLSYRYLTSVDIEQAFAAQLQTLLRQTSITVIAELGRTTHPLRDILNLQVDDVLKLNTGPQDMVTINVNDVPKFLGSPGVAKGSRAVQVTKMLYQDGR